MSSWHWTVRCTASMRASSSPLARNWISSKRKTTPVLRSLSRFSYGLEDRDCCTVGGKLFNTPAALLARAPHRARGDTDRRARRLRFAICGANAVAFETSASTATQPPSSAIRLYSPRRTVLPTPRSPVTMRTARCSREPSARGEFGGRRPPRDDLQLQQAALKCDEAVKTDWV